MAPTMLPGDEQQGVLGGRLDGGPGEGARSELPRGPQVRLVVPVRGGGIAGLSGGEHGERRVEVREVHHNTPRGAVSYTHLRAHETPEHLVCRLLLEKKKK